MDKAMQDEVSRGTSQPLVTVRMLRANTLTGNVAGDICGLPAPLAERLIKNKHAVLVKAEQAPAMNKMLKEEAKIGK